MKKKVCRTIGSVMLLIAVVFVAYALTHPEATCLLSVTVTRSVRFVCFHNGSTADCSREGLIGPLQFCGPA